MEWSEKIRKKLKCLFLFEGVPESGNHNWIEVFDHRYADISRFLTFSYLMYISGPRSGILLRLPQQVCILSRLKFLKFAILRFTGSGETLADPCDKWFCSPDKMKGGTQVKTLTFFLVI